MNSFKMLRFFVETYNLYWITRILMTRKLKNILERIKNIFPSCLHLHLLSLLLFFLLPSFPLSLLSLFLSSLHLVNQLIVCSLNSPWTNTLWSIVHWQGSQASQPLLPACRAGLVPEENHDKAELSSVAGQFPQFPLVPYKLCSCGVSHTHCSVCLESISYEGKWLFRHDLISLSIIIAASLSNRNTGVHGSRCTPWYSEN